MNAVSGVALRTVFALCLKQFVSGIFCTLIFVVISPGAISGPIIEMTITELATTQSAVIEQPVTKSPTTKQPKIAIIIDDLGYRLKEGRKSIELEFPLTLAIIPSSPHAKKFAAAANCQTDKEILVHMPMTPSREMSWEAGLTENMDEQEFIQTAEDMLANVPFAIGVNNHGGSILTQDRQRMDWLMGVLGSRDLFFVDSRTTPDSIADKAAASAKIPYTVRDVFLDNERDEAAINKQVDRLLSLATRHGRAIAIGHPYSETLSVLEKRLQEIEDQGFQLVGISQLLRNQENLAANSVGKPTENQL